MGKNWASMVLFLTLTVMWYHDCLGLIMVMTETARNSAMTAPGRIFRCMYQSQAPLFSQARLVNLTSFCTETASEYDFIVLEDSLNHWYINETAYEIKHVVFRFTNIFANTIVSDKAEF